MVVALFLFSSLPAKVTYGAVAAFVLLVLYGLTAPSLHKLSLFNQVQESIVNTKHHSPGLFGLLRLADINSTSTEQVWPFYRQAQYEILFNTPFKRESQNWRKRALAWRVDLEKEQKWLDVLAARAVQRCIANTKILTESWSAQQTCGPELRLDYSSNLGLRRVLLPDTLFQQDHEVLVKLHLREIMGSGHPAGQQN